MKLEIYQALWGMDRPFVRTVFPKYATRVIAELKGKCLCRRMKRDFAR